MLTRIFLLNDIENMAREYSGSNSEYGTLDLDVLWHHFQELSFSPSFSPKLAHGGQVKTDIATIESESDPAERLLLTRGFEVGYIVPLSLKQEFLKYNAVLNLMNIYCNLSTLDNLISKTNDRKEAFNLLKGWIKWKDRGSDLNTYPFTTDRLSMLGYNRLLRNYGNVIPRE